MRAVVLFSVTCLVGQVLCSVRREFEVPRDEKDSQLQHSDDREASVDNYVEEDSEAGDRMTVTARSWNKVLTVSNGGTWGQWGSISLCPGNSLAAGYDMKIEPKVRYDNTALNAIKLICVDEYGRVKGEVTSSQGRWGTWVGETKCSGDWHLSAFDLQVQKGQGSCKDDTAANYVKFKCRNFCCHANVIVKPPGHGLWGTWGPWSSDCPKGSGICGIQTRVEKYQGTSGDDTALNDVKFFCCEFPKKTNSSA